MRKLEEIENQIKALSREEFKELREWVLERRETTIRLGARASCEAFRLFKVLVSIPRLAK